MERGGGGEKVAEGRGGAAIYLSKSICKVFYCSLVISSVNN